LLRQLDQMLATYEKNGGQHYGLYYLRAASLAMQGRKTEAEAALRPPGSAAGARRGARAAIPSSGS
jgi:hypothetical protein